MAHHLLKEEEKRRMLPNGWKLGIDVFKERGGTESEDGIITEEEFKRVKMPLAVACTFCSMSMVVTGAFVSPDGETFCAECGGEPPEGE